MDFKKLKKNSSKKFIKTGLGIFLSPRETTKGDNAEFSIVQDETLTTNFKKTVDWASEITKIDRTNELQHKEKNLIDDIPSIHSVDAGTDDITDDIAKAPPFNIKEIYTYSDFKNDILSYSAYGSFKEDMLQVLMKGLHLDSLLSEPDVPWTKENLFCELVSRSNEKKLLL